MPTVRSGPTPLSLLSGTSDAELSRETVFDVLRNERRRYVLHHLKQEQAPVDVGALAEQVAVWEYDTTIAELSGRERQRVYVSLVQTHLPMMTEAGIVTRDEDAGTVALTEAAAGLDVYLEVVPEDDIDWAQYYLGVAAINAALLGVATLELPLLSRAPEALWALAVAVVFLLAASVHFMYHRRNRLGVAGPPPD